MLLSSRQKLKFLLLLFVSSLTICISNISEAKLPIISRIHAADKTNSSRIVIEVSEKLEYNFSILKNPNRLVIQLNKSSEKTPISYINKSIFIHKISCSNKGDKTEIIVYINPIFEVIKDFTLKKTVKYKHRIVFDIKPIKKYKDTKKLYKISRHKKYYFEKGFIYPTPKLREKLFSSPKKLPLIVLDAGHGGHDPGALGSRVKEKDITLSYAKELRRQLIDAGEYKVYMIRDKDVFVSLQNRKNKARSVNTDMFISLHANSSYNYKTKGLSIYTLSESASDKIAKSLSRKKNKDSIIPGVNLNEESYSSISNILIDLVKRKTTNISAEFAEILINNMHLGKITILKNPHRFAGFQVLKSAKIPSVLVELGYLTNKNEERNLMSTRYKRNLIRIIVKSIKTHFKKFSN